VNRALRLGDRVTYRDGCDLDVSPYFLLYEWHTNRDISATVTGRHQGQGRRRPTVEVQFLRSGGLPPLQMSFYAGSLRLDDRPRFWKRHDEIEAEKVAARAAKKGGRR
jgi:hypothetical protein